MNALIREQLKRIQQLTEELREAFQQSSENLIEKQKAYQDLAQKYWGRGKDIAVLNRNEEDYTVLAEENERLRNQHKELKERLERVLKHTKALVAEFRS